MLSIARPAIKAFNDILEAIKANALSSGQDTTVTLYTFGEYTQPVARKFLNVPIAHVQYLDNSSYRAQGGTPMFDCIGEAIDAARDLDDSRNTAFVMSIITDGEENQSSKYDADEIKQRIQQMQATDRWTITFSVPPGGKHTITSFGIPSGNVQEWEATAEGVARSAQAHASSYASYFVARSAGATKTDGFFTTDMSKVRAATVKKQLTDVAKLYVALRVPAETEIKPFVERSGFTYVKGGAYYQLTKDETIQHYKKILLREKNKSAVYGGAEARDLLNMPDGLDLQVRPGNHANWDIFVQSTSVNRKLVRGTTLLYAR
jgi:hypothetical protein